jgi:CBS domain containing-hemolysin-like protein
MYWFIEILIIIILIALNGVFAMSEFAIVSAKKTRLQQRAERGDSQAATALELANEPTTFLSTIQIGITLVGIFAGAYGGVTIAKKLASYFTSFPSLIPFPLSRNPRMFPELSGSFSIIDSSQGGIRSIRDKDCHRRTHSSTRGIL